MFSITNFKHNVTLHGRDGTTDRSKLSVVPCDHPHFTSKNGQEIELDRGRNGLLCDFSLHNICNGTAIIMRRERKSSPKGYLTKHLMQLVGIPLVLSPSTFFKFGRGSWFSSARPPLAHCSAHTITRVDPTPNWVVSDDGVQANS